MYILGISAFYHDSAACLIKDGEIVAAAQEERFSRIKHDHRFPKRAIAFCLRFAGIGPDQLERIAFYEQPRLKFDRLLKTYLSYAPKGLRSFATAMPLWLGKKLWITRLLRQEIGYRGSVVMPQHHQSHAASAFFPSPYPTAAFLTADGVGEWATTSFGIGRGNTIQISKEIHFPHSLGLLYSAFTYYTGFKVNSGEYKLMGLAPYGEPVYVDRIYDNLIDVQEDGSFRLNMEYFDFPVGFTMTNDRFHRLFDGSPRQPESDIRQKDMDLARSIQVVTEEVLLKIVNYIHRQTGQKNLCLAGGVALNCVANQRLLKEGLFDNIWIQPAAGDAGGALGAALYVWHQHCGNKRSHRKYDQQKGSYLGSSYSDSQIKKYLDQHAIVYTKLSKRTLPGKVASLIAAERVVGWFHGRMEYGPRALGSRSILADARSSRMQSVVNQKIKFRESFRPFAPAVLAEQVHVWFDLVNKYNKKTNSPYMLLTAPVHTSKRKRLSKHQRSVSGLEKLKIPLSRIPAVTHVDYSARIQTVHKETNPLFHALLDAFYRKTKCPVIINTSFNVRGEPIVESPKDAYTCFMRTQMDYLVLGSFLLDKKKQPVQAETKDWKHIFLLD